MEDKSNNNSITIYPGRGSSGLGSEISSCLAYNKNYLLILDNDKGCNDAKKYYIKIENFGYTDIEKRIENISSIVDNKSITDTMFLLSNDYWSSLGLPSEYSKTENKKDAKKQKIKLLNQLYLDKTDIPKMSDTFNENVDKIVKFIENYFDSSAKVNKKPQTN